MPLERSRFHQTKTSLDRPHRDRHRVGEIRGASPGDRPHRDNMMADGSKGDSPEGQICRRADESRGQPQGKQNEDQTGTNSGWNRVGKKRTYTRESELQTRDKGKQATRFEDMDKEIQRIRSQIAAGRVDYIPSSDLQIREPVLVPNRA